MKKRARYTFSLGGARARSKPLLLGLLSFIAAFSVLTHARELAVSPEARQAVLTIRELRAIGLPDSEESQNVPPLRVPGLLRQLN